MSIVISKEQIKKLAKNIAATSRKKAPQPLKHSEILEIAANTFGFKDYNGLSGLLSQSGLESESKQSIHCKTLEEIIIEVDAKKEREYPSSFNRRFVSIRKTDTYELLIDREYDGVQEKYSLLMRLAHTMTDRVFYDPGNQEFVLYVYPTIKEAATYYNISIKDAENIHKRIFEIIHHLNEKTWFTKEIALDFLDLAKIVIDDKKRIDKLVPNRTEEKRAFQKHLESLYHEGGFNHADGEKYTEGA